MLDNCDGALNCEATVNAGTLMSRSRVVSHDMCRSGGPRPVWPCLSKSVAGNVRGRNCHPLLLPFPSTAPSFSRLDAFRGISQQTTRIISLPNRIMEPQSTQTIEAVNTVSISDFWDPLYDSFDVDLFMKVLSHTAFSEHSHLLSCGRSKSSTV